MTDKQQLCTRIAQRERRIEQVTEITIKNSVHVLK